MNRINFLSLFFAAFGLLFLSACQTTGYSPWIFSSSSKPAEAPPKVLAQTLPDMQAEQNTQAQDPRDGLMTQIEMAENRYLDGGHDQNQSQRTVETDDMAQGENPQYQREEEILPVLPAINAAPVKVAILLPLSGRHKALGESMLNAAQLALFDVGNSGFELLPRDTKGTPEGAQAAAHEVLNEGAKLILGPVFASAVKEVKSIADRSDVNVIAFSTDWGLAGNNTFIMGFLPFDQIERLAQYVALKNLQKVGIITPSSEYGSAVASAYQSVARRYGLPRAEITYFPADSTNLAPIVRDFTKYDDRNTEAEMLALEEGVEIDDIEIPLPYDAVLMPVGGQTALSLSNLLSHFDMPPRAVRRLGTGLFDDEGLATEQSMSGAWFAAPSPKLRQNFERRYKDLYGRAAPRLATLAYDSTALAAVLSHRGMKTIGTADFSSRAITNPNGFAGLDGIFRFRRNGTAERGLAILQFRNGNIEIVEDAPNTFQRPAGY